MKLNLRIIRSAIAVACLISPAAQAAWRVQPTLDLQSEASTNVPLTEPEDSGTVSVGTFQIATAWIDQRNRLELLAGINQTEYGSIEAADQTTSQYLNLSTSRRQSWGSLSLSGTYSKDDLLNIYNLRDDGMDTEEGTDPLEEQFLDEDDSGQSSPSDDFDFDQDLVRQAVDRTRISISPSLSYNLTPLSSLRLSYQQFEQNFERAGEEAGLRDSDFQQFSLEYRHRLTPRNRVIVEVNSGRLELDSNQEFDSNEIRVRWSHVYSRRLSLTTFIGARSVDDGDNTENGALFGLESSYKLRSGRLSGRYERSIYPSGAGQIVETDRLALSFSKPLSDRLNLSLSLRAYEAESTNTFDLDTDRKSFDVGPEVTWRINDTWTFRTRYQYQWIDRKRSRLQGIDSASSHDLTFGIAYRPRRQF